MKNFKKSQNPYILTVLTILLFNCNIAKEKLVIKEIEAINNGKQKTISKFKVKTYSTSFSFSRNTDSSKNKLKNVTISFTNNQLSLILNKLEYRYNKEKLKNNPYLNIDYFKENTTKERAYKEIISTLKEKYNI